MTILLKLCIGIGYSNFEMRTIGVTGDVTLLDPWTYNRL